VQANYPCGNGYRDSTYNEHHVSKSPLASLGVSVRHAESLPGPDQRQHCKHRL
jgi:hypothetical protein